MVDIFARIRGCLCRSPPDGSRIDLSRGTGLPAVPHRTFGLTPPTLDSTVGRECSALVQECVVVTKGNPEQVEVGAQGANVLSDCDGWICRSTCGSATCVMSTRTRATGGVRMGNAHATGAPWQVCRRSDGCLRSSPLSCDAHHTSWRTEGCELSWMPSWCSCVARCRRETSSASRSHNDSHSLKCSLSPSRSHRCNLDHNSRRRQRCHRRGKQRRGLPAEKSRALYRRQGDRAAEDTMIPCDGGWVFCERPAAETPDDRRREEKERGRGPRVLPAGCGVRARTWRDLADDLMVAPRLKDRISKKVDKDAVVKQLISTAREEASLARGDV